MIISYHYCFTQNLFQNRVLGLAQTYDPSFVDVALQAPKSNLPVARE